MADGLTITSTVPLHTRALSTSQNASNSAEPIHMPRLGFGVYRSDPSVCQTSSVSAIRAGYRHIDSAQFYRNEAEVGQAVIESGVPRSEIFSTTKILSAGGSVDASYRKCVESVRKLDPGEDGSGGYVDLFLIHSPNSGREGRREMWLALERLWAEGKAKAIGVSNWGIGHIKEMQEYATAVWPPHVEQIELHPWCQQRELVAYCEKLGTVVQAYCPIVRNYKANDGTLKGLAAKNGRSTAQVLVRWSLQKGYVPLVKSDNEGRIKENADVFSWELTEEDMNVLDALDEGEAGSIVQVAKNTL
ncbi:uncharacterized protein HMPREF1541_04671 [Cyphellophora europaea CBS 101466]|uniref:D-xylose reductase [NAD(P)H] n=1 Tax=Cyphellophora europaea (strain CBS 101466) TaxID=1220924 RepID=W2RXK7_CYPE1|nr:uncharacterized protein HMPREF1541_04671 [Cyphellophora europaea CBS 101466]ETN40394.1 hypothetical protein HMPREF1541_04671 [Cyphellophora europaea CBS 101466]